VKESECVRVWVEEWDLRAPTVFGGEFCRVNKTVTPVCLRCAG
jgi:hypothetical protein